MGGGVGVDLQTGSELGRWWCYSQVNGGGGGGGGGRGEMVATDRW